MILTAALLITGCPEDDGSAKSSPSVASPAPAPKHAPAPSPETTMSPEPASSPAPPAASSTPAPSQQAANPSATPDFPERDDSDIIEVSESPGSADVSGESAESDASVNSATTSADDEKDVFKVQITLVRDEVTEYDEPTFFVGEQAIELAWSDSGMLLATYNLEDMSWWEASSGNHFTLADCVDWAQRSTKVTREAIEDSPDSVSKRYVIAMMEPDLEVTDGDGTLTVSNEFYTLTYTSDGPIEPSRLKRFLAYDRLKNYRKSILFRDSPPFMRLEIDDLLEERSMFPHRTDLTVKLPGAESHSVITMSIEPVTEEELETLSSYIE